MKNLAFYKGVVRKALKAAGKYSEALEPQVYSLASALRTLASVNEGLDNLDTLTVETPQGIKAHPLFKLCKDAEDSVTRQMRNIGLCDRTGGITAEREATPLESLLKEVKEAE